VLKNFPRAISRQIVARFTPTDPPAQEVSFEHGRVAARDAGGQELVLTKPTAAALTNLRAELERFFTADDGFGPVVRLNYTDGVRVYFGNGDVAHVRPSGNADELRLYAVADTQTRADAIAKAGVTEPDGILRQLERVTRQHISHDPTDRLTPTP
jgi:phosphomannomutase